MSAACERLSRECIYRCGSKQQLKHPQRDHSAAATRCLQASRHESQKEERTPPHATRLRWPVVMVTRRVNQSSGNSDACSNVVPPVRPSIVPNQIAFARSFECRIGPHLIARSCIAKAVCRGIPIHLGVCSVRRGPPGGGPPTHPISLRASDCGEDL